MFEINSRISTEINDGDFKVPNFVAKESDMLRRRWRFEKDLQLRYCVAQEI